MPPTEELILGRLTLPMVPLLRGLKFGLGLLRWYAAPWLEKLRVAAGPVGRLYVTLGAVPTRLGATAAAFWLALIGAVGLWLAPLLQVRVELELRPLTPSCALSRFSIGRVVATRSLAPRPERPAGVAACPPRDEVTPAWLPVARAAAR